MDVFWQAFGFFAIVVYLITLYFLLWWLIPQSLVDWYKRYDDKIDIVMSISFFILLTILFHFILISTLTGGPILIDAMAFNEGYVEVPFLGTLILLCVIYSALQTRSKGGRK